VLRAENQLDRLVFFFVVRVRLAGAGVSLWASVTIFVTNFRVPDSSNAIVVCRSFISIMVPGPKTE